jgi:hypothetical protein
MVMRLVLLVVVVIAIVGIFASFTSSAAMMGIFQHIPTPILTVAYAGEINQLSSLVDDFIELRNNRSSDNAKELAEDLDQRINNLGLVKVYCNEQISTLELAFEKNPYKKLQKFCPALKDLSLTKAAQLFGQI